MLLGSTVGPYRLMHQLGAPLRGAIAEKLGDSHVWLAESAESRQKRWVVLKLRKASRKTKRVFEREVELLTQLRGHPGVATMVAHGAADGWLWIELEYIQGSDLGRILEGRRRLQVRESTQLLRDLAVIVSSLDKLGVAHAALVPANILIGTDGAMRLCGFGQAAAPKDHASLVPTGRTIGYQAPEVLESGLHTPSAHVFALGALLFEMLTGHALFGGKNDHERRKSTLDGQLSRLSDFGVQNDTLETAIARMTAARPEKRPATAWGSLVELEGLRGATAVEVGSLVVPEAVPSQATCKTTSGNWENGRPVVPPPAAEPPPPVRLPRSSAQMTTMKCFVPSEAPDPTATPRVTPESQKVRIIQGSPATADPPIKEYPYDVVISYASENETFATETATAIRGCGVKVFFDKFEDDRHWGKDMYPHFVEVFYEKGLFCIVIVSAAYAEKNWTRLELGAAFARALTERNPYIFPVRLDDTRIPGLLPTIKYLDGRKRSPADIASVMVRLVREHQNRVRRQRHRSTNSDPNAPV